MRLAFLLPVLVVLDLSPCAALAQHASTGAESLPAPYLLHPEEGAVISQVQAMSGVFFSWAPVPEAVAYRIEWFVDESVWEDTVAGTTYLRTFSHPPGTQVAWRVTAIDGSGEAGASSEMRTISIRDEEGDRPTPTPLPLFLAPPQLLLPEDSAAFSARQLQEGIVLQWTAVAGSSGYRVNFTVNGIPQRPLDAAGTSLTLVLTVDAPATIQWAVQALDGSGQIGPSSATRSFRVTGSELTPSPEPVPQQLSPPTLISPEDRAWVPLQEAFSGVEFRWSEVSGAASYMLVVNRDGIPETVRETGDTSISVLFSLIEEVDLLWTVSAVDVTGTRRAYAPPRMLRIRLGEQGDLDLSGGIDVLDLYLLSSMWASESDPQLLPRGDLDGDGLVTSSDLLLFREIWRTIDQQISSTGAGR